MMPPKMPFNMDLIVVPMLVNIVIIAVLAVSTAFGRNSVTVVHALVIGVVTLVVKNLVTAFHAS
jgi:hypothetical protein